MTFGIEWLTLVHVAISLLALAAGFVVVGGLLTNNELRAANLVFLATTILTNASGFLFPFVKVLPSHILAAISLVLLAVAVYAYYGARLAGWWRSIYVVTAIASLYINVLVLLVQTFIKNPALAALAPNQNEPAFVATQGIAFMIFLILGYVSFRNFGSARA